jgi:ferritin
MKGYSGVSTFLYGHSDEERQHMLKIVHYVNERGGHAIVPSLDKPDTNFNDLRSVFQRILEHEVSVSQSINDIVDLCLKEKDHSTNNFMQWYVSEQMEEESLAKSIIDKLDLIGTDSTGLYFFDRELGNGNAAV